MEKFQKYCLSVLLVIICSNVSAQIGHGSADHEDYKKLYEFYTKLLISQDCQKAQQLSAQKKVGHFAIHQKQNAADLIENIFPNRQNNHSFYKLWLIDLEEERDCRILYNFEKLGKQHGFAEIISFKSKVSKVRNKDYLEAIS
ncbi:hypothetical protein ODZ84_13270 [Chryseobacterium fluminis]|uniref:hypothetical protein n=1 Tax=Chryseobacterium fluminis TaxID=2983606 RepID=UPI00225875F8|nr:hypothetical protein [Chryseobacterium sp. MMS21-Ot14]UZT96196.1 hypothetical protein ODZ84_13270 [Chryseobacterium sp. MMS21-Ot14]